MCPDGPERKLAAILSADVVGYSRLMAEDEDSTLRTLAAYREEVRLLARQHRGRVVDFTGDNFLAEFPSALEAVRCAVEIQSVMSARNAQLPLDRRMEFRIGAHLGDVRVEHDSIFGDGVNIAAQDCPGGSPAYASITCNPRSRCWWISAFECCCPQSHWAV